VIYRFHPAAEAEHLEQIAFYEGRQIGLGARYRERFLQVIGWVCAGPVRYPIVRRPDIRRVRLLTFPLAITFTANEVGRFRCSRSPMIAVARVTGSAGPCDHFGPAPAPLCAAATSAVIEGVTGAGPPAALTPIPGHPPLKLLATLLKPRAANGRCLHPAAQARDRAAQGAGLLPADYRGHAGLHIVDCMLVQSADDEWVTVADFDYVHREPRFLRVRRTTEIDH
jgi:toxin ParE1/3/4